MSEVTIVRIPAYRAWGDPVQIVRFMQAHAAAGTLFQIGSTRFHYCQDPAIGRRWLASRPERVALSPLYDLLKPVIGDGLTASQGEAWKQLRTEWSRHFTAEALRSRLPELRRQVTLSLLQLDAFAAADKSFSAIKFFNESSLGSIAAFLGLTLSSPRYLLRLFRVLSLAAGQKFFLPFVVPRPMLRLVSAATFPIVRRVRLALVRGLKDRDFATIDRECFAARILAKSSDIEGRRSGMRTAVDQLLTAILAGYETTGSTLCSLFFYLEQNPQIRQSILGELQGVSWEAIESPEQVPHCYAAVLEAIRLSAPSWLLTRTALATIDAGFVQAEAGDVLIVSPYFLHRDARHWTDAEKFRPERFLRAGKVVVPGEFLGFGAGSRYCVGAPLAILEMVLMTVAVLQRGNLHFLNRELIREFGVVARVTEQVQCRFTFY